MTVLMNVSLKFLCGGLALLAATAAAAQGYVSPAKGQTPEQQQKAEGESPTWAVGQTGYNPAHPPSASAAAPAQPAPVQGGGRLRDAPAGAVVGGITDSDIGHAALAGAACLEGRGYGVN